MTGRWRQVEKAASATNAWCIWRKTSYDGRRKRGSESDVSDRDESFAQLVRLNVSKERMMKNMMSSLTIYGIYCYGIRMSFLNDGFSNLYIDYVKNSKLPGSIESNKIASHEILLFVLQPLSSVYQENVRKVRRLQFSSQFRCCNVWRNRYSASIHTNDIIIEHQATLMTAWSIAKCNYFATKLLKYAIHTWIELFQSVFTFWSIHIRKSTQIFWILMAKRASRSSASTLVETMNGCRQEIV